MYGCYKLSKSRYRQACRLAFNTRVSKLHTSLNMLCRTRNSKHFWKLVGNTRREANDCSKDISIDVLEQYFEQKFSVSNRVVTAEMIQAQDRIDAQLKRVNTHGASDIQQSETINKAAETECITSTRRDYSGAFVICYGQSNY